MIMIIDNFSINLLVVMVCAALISFTMTPIVRVLAHRVGAIDVPKDDRRMHKVPIPRMGGLAIFAGFVITTLVFCEISDTLLAIWFGGLVIVTLGILDDIFRLNAILKLVVQIAVAFIPVIQGMQIEFINIFGNYIVLGPFSIPFTVLWVVGLTNAINLIDGLDGLSCGVSSICALSLLLVTLVLGENPMISLVIGTLAGACIGFLPFNTNPAKIFMGDTGALFLGYTLAVLSLEGLFKFHTVISFLVPLSIFGLPVFDTLFAIVRRLCHGQAPWHADRGHIHHRLIDMGFNQKQSVCILYSVSGILGISAVMFTTEFWGKAALMIISGFAIFLTNYFIMKNPQTRQQSGLDVPPSLPGIPKHRTKRPMKDRSHEGKPSA